MDNQEEISYCGNENPTVTNPRIAFIPYTSRISVHLSIKNKKIVRVWYFFVIEM